MTRLPGLQVPRSADVPTRQFMEAVKERLEFHSGERKSGLDRYVTLRELQQAGLISAAVKGDYGVISDVGSNAGSSTTDNTSTLDNPLSLFGIDADQLGDDTLIIVYDTSTGTYRRLTYSEFAELFLLSQEDSEANATVTFVEPVDDADPYPTRVRFEDDDGATDEKAWDFEIDTQTFKVRTLDDTDANPVEAVVITRTGTAITSIDLKCTNLYHNGSPITGVGALDDLTDVDTTGVTTGDVLSFDGTDWVPTAPSGATGPTGPTGPSGSSDPNDGLTTIDDLDGFFSSDWSSESSGTGAAISRTAIAGRGGIITLGTGTTSTGYSRASRSSSVSTAQSIYLASDTYPLFLEAEIRTPTLPDGTNTFSADVGFRTTLNATNALACIGIRWDSGGAAAAFVGVARNAAGSSTTTVGTGATPAANTWYRVKLEVGSTYVKGYVWVTGSWVQVFNITTTTPDAAMAAYMAVTKSAGSTSRTMDIDWVKISIPTSGGRPA